MQQIQLSEITSRIVKVSEVPQPGCRLPGAGAEQPGWCLRAGGGPNPNAEVVFSRDATIGRCAITTKEMAVSHHFIAWVCGEEILPEFLLLRLKSMTQELERLTFGATLKTIGMPDVKTLATPVPPIKEQREIVDEVLEVTAKLDAMSAGTLKAIALLQERRSA